MMTDFLKLSLLLKSTMEELVTSSILCMNINDSLNLTGARINTGQRIAGNSPYNGNQFSVVGDFDGDGHVSKCNIA
jgi:hypothetical protein